MAIDESDERENEEPEPDDGSHPLTEHGIEKWSPPTKPPKGEEDDGESEDNDEGLGNEEMRGRPGR